MHGPHHSRILHVACESRRKEEREIGNKTEMKRHKQKHPVESFRAYPTQITALPPSPSTSLPGRTIVYSTPLSRICARNLPKWKQTFRETSKGVGNFQTLPKRERA